VLKTILRHKHLFYICSFPKENTQHSYQQVQHLSSWMCGQALWAGHPLPVRRSRPITTIFFLLFSLISQIFNDQIKIKMIQVLTLYISPDVNEPAAWKGTFYRIRICLIQMFWYLQYKVNCCHNESTTSRCKQNTSSSIKYATFRLASVIPHHCFLFS